MRRGIRFHNLESGPRRTTIALLCATTLVGTANNSTARAQARGEAPGTDFSGVYVGGPLTQPDTYPLSAEGIHRRNAYDAFTASREDDCAPPTMPGILLGGLIAGMQITLEDGRIEMRLERNDATRSIQITGVAPPSNQAHTNLGYSTGSWDGAVLTVETTHLLSSVLGRDSGYPLSEEARVVERYWREPGNDDLQMELVIDDPANYTQPVTISREWIWSPDEVVKPWSCFNLGPRESEPPDIEELKRRLGEL